jgi:iron complex outermembrane receptor protein
VKGLNLTNQDIRYATSILANVAPAGGRALLAGVKASF